MIARQAFVKLLGIVRIYFQNIFMKKIYKYFFGVIATLLVAFLILFGFEMFRLSGVRTTVNKVEKVNRNK